MQVPTPITRAHDLVMWIEGLLNGLSMPSTDRVRIAGACFAASLQHHHAIVVLFRERLNGSAFALMRSVYEAYVRGIWFARCATEVQLSSFLQGEDPPKLGVMLGAIEVLAPFDSKTLSSTKIAGWSTMCSYTHTGAHQVQRFNTPAAIESRHSLEEIEEVLRLTRSYALFAALGMVMLAENEPLAQRLLAKTREVAGQ
jgi:hypothetical protein